MPVPRIWQGLHAQNRSEWGSSLSLPAAAGTTILHLGVAEESGLVLRQITCTGSAALGVSGTNYHTFRPFITTIKDGVGTTRYLGTSRGTNAVGLIANVPLRAHDPEFLNERVPKGATVGVEITTTGTPVATRALFQARLFYAR